LTEKFFPAILLVMHEWAASDFYNKLLALMPLPIRDLVLEARELWGGGCSVGDYWGGGERNIFCIFSSVPFFFMPPSPSHV
jgi:hypothetical protein